MPTIEQNLTRIADALERIADHLTASVPEVFQPEKPPATSKKKTSKKKSKKSSLNLVSTY